MRVNFQEVKLYGCKSIKCAGGCGDPMSDEKKPMISLGYANGWGKESPPEVKKCAELGHRQFSTNEGRCLTKYGCEICGFFYLVDSSD